MLAAAALAALLPLHAQDSKPAEPLYRVEINFHDGADSGSMTDRRYTLLVNDSHKAVFKAGSKNPVASGVFEPTSGPMVTTQFTYLDVGVNIECTVRGLGSRANVHGSLDLSNIGPNETAAVAGVRNPTIRQTKLDLDTTVELGKATVVASIDDPLTSRKLQVEATVTKVN
jgi:general secretion pathway protein D